MRKIYFAEIDSVCNNYTRLIKIEEDDNSNKIAYLYDLNLCKWIQSRYFSEFNFDRKFYDELSEDVTNILISRWEKNS